MLEYEYSNFIALLYDFVKIYPKNLDEAEKKIYWKVLKNYSLAKIEDALIEYTKNPANKYFPKPAEIIGCMLKSQSSEKAKSENMSWEAYKSLMLHKHPAVEKTIAYVELLRESAPEKGKEAQKYWMECIKDINEGFGVAISNAKGS